MVGSKFFPFRLDPFSEGDWCAGKRMGSHKCLLPCEIGGKSTRPRGYKTLFMLNSAEHEIVSAYKYENANNSWHFHIY